MIKALVFAALLFIIWRFGIKLLSQPKNMARADAAKLLGVDPNAQAAAVVDAHRRLIAKVHPDAGGSAELAARINEARDVLLKP